MPVWKKKPVSNINDIWSVSYLLLVVFAYSKNSKWKKVNQFEIIYITESSFLWYRQANLRHFHLHERNSNFTVIIFMAYLVLSARVLFLSQFNCHLVHLTVTLGFFVLVIYTSVIQYAAANVSEHVLVHVLEKCICQRKW